MKLELAAPKKPPSSYMLFCQDKRVKVKEEMPGLKATEILSELGKRWADANDGTKAEYTEKAAEAKVQYKKDLEEYEKDYVADAKVKVNEDPNAPKRSLSSFMLFCQEEKPKVQEEMPNLKLTELFKELGKRWADADEDTKAEYTEKAAKAKEHYKKDLEEYIANKDSKEGPAVP